MRQLVKRLKNRISSDLRLLDAGRWLQDHERLVEQAPTGTCDWPRLGDGGRRLCRAPESCADRSDRASDAARDGRKLPQRRNPDANARPRRLDWLVALGLVRGVPRAGAQVRPQLVEGAASRPTPSCIIRGDAKGGDPWRAVWRTMGRSAGNDLSRGTGSHSAIGRIA